MKRTPCPTCPWRVTTPKRGFPGGIVDAAGLLSQVIGDRREVMQCHCTPDDRPDVCVGFALQVGSECPAYRELVQLGRINPEQLTAAEPLLTLIELLQKHGGVPC